MTCEHAEYDLVPTPELTHYGKYVCRSCHGFLGWAKKPATLEREKRNAAILALLEPKPLTEWEKGFVLSLMKQGTHFSPKQQARLDEMASKYGC